MHGGDWAAFVQEYGKMPLDFSANISPLGVPDSVKRAVMEAAAEADRYPDPLCRELRNAIGEAEHLPPEYILCGNGAADLIWRLASVCSCGKALIPVPSFSEYRAALEHFGSEIETFVLQEKDDFRLKADFLIRLQELFSPVSRLRDGHACYKTGSVWLCEPANPAGVLTDRDLLTRILEYCALAGIVLVVDECFLELTDDPEGHTLKGMLKMFPNLVILRAFTKTYAMAGLRLGYCLCSDSVLLSRIYCSGQPWNVSLPAQRAGMAALKTRMYREEVRSLVASQRPVLQKGLEELGFRVIPGEANYLLFHAGMPDCRYGVQMKNASVMQQQEKRKDSQEQVRENSRSLSDRLKEKGILIRDCCDYEGLEKGWYRIAVRTEAENRLFLETMRETVHELRSSECRIS